MTFQQRIRSSNALITQLATSLSINANASREVQETSQYVALLQSQIKSGTKGLKSLHLKVWTCRSNYEGLRDGSTKRLFSKVSGKTDELVAKTIRAEQEYQDALEEQAKAHKHLETCQINLEKAQDSLPHLQDQAAIHATTLAELDNLYSSIFSLPHAEYPQEISVNREITLLQVPIAELQNQIDNEARALKSLTSARKCLIWSQASIQNAQDADNTKGGPFNEHHNIGLNIVRNIMSTAQLHAMQAESAYRAAQLAQPSIQNMRELKILEEGLLLQNSYRPGLSLLLNTEELTKKIGRCIVELRPVIEDVGKEIEVARERVQLLMAEKNDLEGEARDLLRRARQDVISAVMQGTAVDPGIGEAQTDGGGQATVEPPSYFP